MSESRLEIRKKMSGSKTFVIIIILSFIIFSIFFLGEKVSELKFENQILEKIIAFNFQYTNKVGDQSLLAESYYTKAIVDYESRNFIGAETNCKLAREYYSETAQSIRNLKAELLSYNEEKNKYENIINVYASMLDEDIKIQENLYEACEYLESASRAYNLGDYPLGEANIERMNEKIRNHDNAVRNYNDKLSQLNFEFKKLLEN